MERKKEQAAILQETITTSGWELIEKWLKDSEERTIEAGVKNILNLKSEEFIKWQGYYAGVLETINSFRGFITSTVTEKKPVKEKPIID